jgi:universal stress protein E
VSVAAQYDYPVAEAIVRRTRRVGADLVLAQCHAGRRTLPSLLRVTDWELVRLCPVPLLLIRNSRPYGKGQVVLAAVDPTHAFEKPAGLDQRILQAATTMQGALKGELHAVHAYVPVPADALSTQAIATSAQTRKRAKDQASVGFYEALRGYDVPQSRQHLTGGPAVDVIADVARRTRSALVVMGAVSRSGLERIFIGSTAERLIDRLPCDVLIIKPAKFKTTVSRARRAPRRIGSTPII